MSDDRWYVMAVVVAVKAPNARLAWSAVNDPEDPNGASVEALFSTNAMRAEQNDVANPDFDIPRVLSHGRALEPIPAYEEENA